MNLIGREDQKFRPKGPNRPGGLTILHLPERRLLVLGVKDDREERTTFDARPE